jgi:hypothetical protein
MKAAKDQEQVTEEVLQRVRAKRYAESGDVSTFIRAMARLRHLSRGSLSFPRRLQRLASGHETRGFTEDHLAYRNSDGVLPKRARNALEKL